MRFRPIGLGLLVLSAVALVFAAGPKQQKMDYSGNPGGVRYLEEGMPPAVVHSTVEGWWQAQIEAAQSGRASTSSNLSYHGGTSDGSSGSIGVETAPKVYVVFWGSQWTNNDPSGEACILVGVSGCPSGVSGNFLGNVGGSAWNNIDTQYCQGVASGTVFCNGAGQAVGNQAGELAGYWYDNGASAPSHPSQSQMASEATRAAAHFGNTTTASNASTQYVIATSHGNNSRGFKTQWCAYHSSTSTSYGDIAYTNLPYMTDGGSSCGANFNGLGPYAGITIVEGHEFSETNTDQFPNGGWLDSGGSENGDKCAWNAATSNQTIGSGTYPVQPIWSNAANGGAGGCVLQ